MVTFPFCRIGIESFSVREVKLTGVIILDTHAARSNGTSSFFINFTDDPFRQLHECSKTRHISFVTTVGASHCYPLLFIVVRLDGIFSSLIVIHLAWLSSQTSELQKFWKGKDRTST